MFAALVSMLLAALSPVPVSASVGDEPPPDRPPATVSDFYPESSNLSDCVGLVEKPGCGSEARGGWAQTAVFGALAVGLGLIIWRITIGVRRNREDLDGLQRPDRDVRPSSP